MNKSNILAKFRDKKYFISLLILIISLVLFIPKAKLILDMEVTGSTNVDLYYAVPIYNTYEQKKYIHFVMEKDKTNYTIPFLNKVVEKIYFKVYDYTQDFSFKINNAYIKLPYLPKIKLEIIGAKNNQITLDEIDDNNSLFVFTKIPYYFSVIPFILVILIITNLLYIFYREISILVKLINKPFNDYMMFIGIILFLLFFEAFKLIGMQSNDFSNMFLSYLYILKEDSYFLSIFILLFYSAVRVKSKYVSLLSLLIILALVSIHILDIALIKLFSIRLRFGEGAGFMLDYSVILKIALSFFTTKAGISSLILFTYTLIFSILIVKKKSLYEFSKQENIVLILLFIIFIPLFTIKMDEVQIDNTILQQSIVDANISHTEKKPYSKEKIEDILNTFKLDYKCVNGINSKKNVIIIIMESVSSYKSKLFSGFDNKTPYIDSLGENNIYVPNYYCNNYNSNQNFYNIMTGIPLISTVNSDRRDVKKLYENSFIKNFQKQGYMVKLYSGVDNNFDGISKISKNAGINEMYDANNKIFSHIEKRYLFNGIEDEELYNVVLNRLKQSNKKQLELTIITTMSTHGPYIDPITQELSYDLTLEYSDNAVNNFIEELENMGYFKNGIVVITSDHRAMLTVTNKEIKKFGNFAHSAIPLVIINGKNKQAITGSYSHTDLGKSLEYLMLKKSCFHQFQYNIFLDSNSNNLGCILYQQGLDFSLVDVKCGNSYGQVLLDGDNTRFIKDKLNIDNNKKQEIIDYINYIRVVE